MVHIIRGKLFCILYSCGVAFVASTTCGNWEPFTFAVVVIIVVTHIGANTFAYIASTAGGAIEVKRKNEKD